MYIYSTGYRCNVHGPQKSTLEFGDVVCSRSLFTITDDQVKEKVICWIMEPIIINHKVEIHAMT